MTPQDRKARPLPLELIAHILHYAGGEERSKMLRASRMWHETLLQPLYAGIHLHTPPGLNSLYTSLRKHPERSRWITDFRLGTKNRSVKVEYWSPADCVKLASLVMDARPRRLEVHFHSTSRRNGKLFSETMGYLDGRLYHCGSKVSPATETFNIALVWIYASEAKAVEPIDRSFHWLPLPQFDALRSVTITDHQMFKQAAECGWREFPLLNQLRVSIHRDPAAQELWYLPQTILSLDVDWYSGAVAMHLPRWSEPNPMHALRYSPPAEEGLANAMHIEVAKEIWMQELANYNGGGVLEIMRADPPEIEEAEHAAFVTMYADYAVASHKFDLVRVTQLPRSVSLLDMGAPPIPSSSSS
ncbi:uncharacterized protein EV422DRAFT_147468 [Fimicolochytrium jonesii]|uniref:uncharacterized protein n=1 Tax=Fimicolochytrium jonesii TaxID=1396493 RepID=UPI0022FDE9EE|nr:uncharacterized protein EV422DRAFT_147468 [Fimicolochytrium jonesii]KAI8825952.1 hypothetical protein EV422DRAFT_147468 [Fimicolochytrium jonesii]